MTKPDISNSAKLLGGYMTATGITDAKTIAETLNIPLRTVQRLKLEYATCANDATGGVLTCANDANSATGGVSESAKCATDGVSPSRVEDTYFPLELEDRPERKVSPPKVPQPIAKPVDFRTMFADPAIEHGLEVQGGKLVLVNGTRAEWLNRFDGDENRLDLALVQAFGELQPNSAKPIKPQVERTLARIAGQKRDHDQRYERTVKANSTKPKGRADGRPSMMELLKAGTVQGAPQ